MESREERDRTGVAPHAVVAVALALALVSCRNAPQVTATAAASTVDSAEEFHEVDSLKDLPAPLQHVLGVDKHGLDGIADKGQNYNSTDVVSRDVPMKRFVLAAVSGDTAIVAVERGGIAWWVEITTFGNIRQTPKIVRQVRTAAVPKTVPELLDASKKKSP